MQRVVITGLGCVSPLGHDVESTWRAILAGKSGAGPITLFDASEHETRFAAEVKDFNPVSLFGRKEARRLDRYAQFASPPFRKPWRKPRLRSTIAFGIGLGCSLAAGSAGLAHSWPKRRSSGKKARGA